MSENKAAVTVAAAIRQGYRVAYSVTVDGKEILSRGEVFSYRRVGNNRAEITLMHSKTGALFTNVLKGTAPVMLTEVTFDPAADAVTNALAQQLTALLKEQMSDFYTLLPIED